jgi:tetratricopeptide (TPR) repeat protein
MIFLSYASEDRQIAREIYQALRRAKINIWFDEVELRVGEAPGRALEEAIAAADGMLLLIGGEAALRKSQQKEIRSALNRALHDEHFRILLVLISNSDPESLPPALQKYPRLDLRDVQQRSGQLARLAAVLAADPDSGTPADDEEVGDRLRDSGDAAGAIPLSEAEPLYRRALAIDEASYGPDHPNVAIRLNNLAELLRAANRLSEAEPLYRRALAIDEASYGPDHPDVAIDLNNLAALLRDTNRLSEAEPLFRRALVISEASYGRDHPNVATGLNNLAALLRATNRLSEAEPLFRRALAIAEASYGPDHPRVAMGLNNLAELLRATNRLSEAEPLYRRALAILARVTRTTGHQHPNLEVARSNYVRALGEFGRTKAEIETALKSVLEGAEQFV